MSEIPTDLKYTSSHEWVRANDDGTITIGITDHAQQLLGDLVYVEPPESARTVSAGEVCGTLESVKAASDIYSPLEGEVVEVNAALDDSPELINQDPYGDGWIFRVRTDAALDDLLDAAAYEVQIAAEEAE
jgi:glycine cleavage system H protein